MYDERIGQTSLKEASVRDSARRRNYGHVHASHDASKKTTKGDSKSESVKKSGGTSVWSLEVGLNLLRSRALALLVRLGGEELCVDQREDTTLRDDNVAEELVELFIVADRELEVTGHDTRLFAAGSSANTRAIGGIYVLVARSVTGQLEDLGSEVLEDGGEVDGRTGTDTGSVLGASAQASTGA